MAYVELSRYVYDCAVCHTRCDNVSKGTYLFDKDAAFSEHYEQLIIARINSSSHFTASKSTGEGYPDISIRNQQGTLVNYLEVKVQQRTFMGVARYLPECHLTPSETIALNLSDLLRYFEIEAKTGIPVSIVWVLQNRPCIVNPGEQLFYFQRAAQLKTVYEEQQHKRRFKRKSGEGDIVDGMHKGVTVNYHFSLKELLPWRF